MSRPSSFRRRLVLISATAVVGPAGITATVIWLAPTDDESADQLAKLSALGEAFGTVSAALSAVAVIGIAASLYFQMQQTRVARIEASRTMRMQLMQFALGKPRYLAAWGFDLDGDREKNSEIAYTSMVFAYLKMSYVLGVLTDFELVNACRVAFHQDTVANFWRGGREVYLRDTFSSEGRRFARLVDEVYAEVSAARRQGSPTQPIDHKDAVSGEARLASKPSRRAAGLAIAIGVSLGVAWQSIRTRHEPRRAAARRGAVSGRKDRS